MNRGATLINGRVGQTRPLNSEYAMVPSPAAVVLSYRHASAYLGLPSAGALRMLVYRRQAPPSLSYGQRDRRFRVVDLEAWVARRAAVSAPPPELEVRRGLGRPPKIEAIARRRRAA